MVTFIFYTIITILVTEFLLLRTLSYLNVKQSKMPLPTELSDIYDTTQYAKQQSYFRANQRFLLIRNILSFAFFLAMFVLGGYALLDGVVRMLTTNEVFVVGLFFAILMLINVLFDLPFEIYNTFVIEEQFGFNKMTPKIFGVDLLKKIFLATIIGGILLAIIVLIFQQLTEWFWLLAWSVVSLFMLFTNLFYSDLIVPLFNKQTLLPNGELRDAIETFAEKVKFNVTDIYVIDSSKRSTKANAYFTGFGKKKRIVLYDTLINQLSTNEIVAVLAHEIGHNKHHHTLKNIVMALSTNLLVFYLFGLILKYDEVAQAAGCSEASFHINLLVFAMLYTPINLFLNIITNQISRQFEYQADSFVAQHGYTNELIQALKKITSQALSNLQPHPLYVFFEYSHPTLYQRIKALNN